MTDASDLSEFQETVIKKVVAADESLPCVFGVHVGEGIQIQGRVGDTDGDAGPLAQILTAIILYLEANSEHDAEEFISLVEDYVQQHRDDDTSFMVSRDIDDQ